MIGKVCRSGWWCGEIALGIESEELITPLWAGLEVPLAWCGHTWHPGHPSQSALCPRPQGCSNPVP